jgi:hypothetical protein
MKQWWAYKHKNGEIKVKPYKNEEQMDDATESDFVEDIVGPFDAETFEKAGEIAKEKLKASFPIFKKIKALIKEGKTDKEISDILNAEEKEEGPLEEKVMELAHAYGKELKKTILIKMREDMDKVKEEFEIDTAITPAYDLYMKTLKEELEYFV